MPPAPATAPARSALAAVVLSGLAPGAGHLYAGRWRRGAVLVGLTFATGLAWTSQAARSYRAAQGFAWPPLLLLLALLVDSGRVARAAPRPFVKGPLQRWWTYAALVVVTGFAAPWLVGKALARQAAVAQVDEAMSPALVPLDVVVVDRRPGTLQRGDVLAVARRGTLLLRRLVGLPGERVEVLHGTVVVGGVTWFEGSARSLRRQAGSLPETLVREGELLVLSDRRLEQEAATWRVARSDVEGRATWVLVPGDRDLLRMGEAVR